MQKRPHVKITLRYIAEERPMSTANFQPATLTTSTGTTSAICPDLLSIRDLGEADGWRGAAVRVFFGLLWWVTGV